LYSKCTQDI